MFSAPSGRSASNSNSNLGTVFELENKQKLTKLAKLAKFDRPIEKLIECSHFGKKYVIVQVN